MIRRNVPRTERCETRVRGGASTRRPSRASSRPRADARPCGLRAPAWQRSRRSRPARRLECSTVVLGSPPDPEDRQGLCASWTRSRSDAEPEDRAAVRSGTVEVFRCEREGITPPGRRPDRHQPAGRPPARRRSRRSGRSISGSPRWSGSTCRRRRRTTDPSASSRPRTAAALPSGFTCGTSHHGSGRSSDQNASAIRPNEAVRDLLAGSPCTRASGPPPRPSPGRLNRSLLFNRLQSGGGGPDGGRTP